MTVSKFIKEDSRGELSVLRTSIVFSCANTKNYYDLLLEDTERAAKMHLSGKDQEDVLNQVRIAREINDMKKCIEQQSYSSLTKARDMFKKD